jgi:hypothetical protein
MQGTFLPRLWHDGRRCLLLESDLEGVGMSVGALGGVCRLSQLRLVSFP